MTTLTRLLFADFSETMDEQLRTWVQITILKILRKHAFTAQYLHITDEKTGLDPEQRQEIYKYL